MKRFDVCIIGGGAAGLAAAASLEDHITVCVLEKNQILGRKVLATGGGRCNITNEACLHRDVTLEFFNGLGLECYHDEEGRYYPYSNQASDVVAALERALEPKNCEIRTGFTVQQIKLQKNGFLIEGTEASPRTGTSKTGALKREMIAAAQVLLATGGKAAPQLGSTGDGYGFAKALGHTTTRIYPILTGIECGDFSEIKGVRAKGVVTLFRDGKKLSEEAGEIQFTKDGVSGICVFNLTPHIHAEPGEPIGEALKRYHLELDLAPDFTRNQLEGRSSSFGILSEKLSKAVPIERIKNWKLPVLGVKGWKDAQCTAGGISIQEVDLETMESRQVPGLYLAGELLDLQGPCGGYNLQNAWETGIRAAKSMNRFSGF